jgi:putative membrane protein
MAIIIRKWFILSLGIFFAAYILPGFDITSVWMIIVGAAFLGLFNITIKPLLLVLTLPFNVLTLGLFTFVINGIVLFIVGSIMKDWTIDSLWTAILAALIISIISLLVNFIFTEDKDRYMHVQTTTRNRPYDRQ